MGVLPPIIFWPAAATLAGLCAVLVIWFAARAAKSAARQAGGAGENPARAVYRRQIQDLDELVDRGLLPGSERDAAHAEAARRLLAEPGLAPERVGARLVPLAVAAVAALGALGLYMWLGSPGQPDQPYKARLTAWRNAPVNSLRPDQVAAVLREVLKDKPNDPRLLALLGRVEQAAGDPVAAVGYLQRAAKLSPNDADLFATLGQAIATAAGDKPTPEAEAAVNHALQIDPKNQSALYYLGGMRAADGDREGAAKVWRQLAGELPENDVRRQPLLTLADRVEKGAPDTPQAAPQAPAASAMNGDQAGFIKGMVASLQAKLDANPNDPAGWARIVRSYHVLGDQAAVDRALAKARAVFKGKPDVLAPIEAAAK